MERAPSAVAIREMTPERIYAALTTGSMQTQSQGLNDAQKKILAEFMSGRPMGSAAAGRPQRCRTAAPRNPPMTDPAGVRRMERLGQRRREHAVPDRPRPPG